MWCARVIWRSLRLKCPRVRRRWQIDTKPSSVVGECWLEGSKVRVAVLAIDRLWHAGQELPRLDQSILQSELWTANGISSEQDGGECGIDHISTVHSMIRFITIIDSLWSKYVGLCWCPTWYVDLALFTRWWETDGLNNCAIDALLLDVTHLLNVLPCNYSKSTQHSHEIV